MSEMLCHRCGRELVPGQGDWYVVRIEAYADPSPPEITEEDLQSDTATALESLVEQMRRSARSEREWLDQVHRRVTLHLCRPCYERWIEDPAGKT